jgi:hypothetical protein
LWILVLLLLVLFAWSFIFNSEHMGIKGKTEARQRWDIHLLFKGALDFSYQISTSTEQQSLLDLASSEATSEAEQVTWIAEFYHSHPLDCALYPCPGVRLVYSCCVVSKVVGKHSEKEWVWL